jgi:ABC-type multidrug transport system ATPase subunit
MVTVQVAIEVRAIGQQARSGDATLHDVSLTIGRGELVAIIGGSGSGKTTLLDAMSGLRPPSSGTVWYIQRSIGYVANGEIIHDILPLARALSYRAALRGLRVDDGAVEEALRVAGLVGRATAAVGGLDAGERRRAAIAAELLAGPSLLFLEEPAAGLDPARSTEVMRLLRRLCDGGTTVVLTTSSPLDAARCDKVAVLASGGHLAFFGTAEAACGYFGADSLDEIYERLAGLGDPAEAWSRRFFHFSRTSAGFTPAVTAAPALGLARLVPDAAGPHSAGQPSTGSFDGDVGGGSAKTGPMDVLPANALLVADADGLGLPSVVDERTYADPLDPGGTGQRVRRVVALMLRPVRQSAVLARRNADVLARSRPALAALAAAPVAVLFAFAVLFGLGAFDAARPGSAFWVVFGGFLVGLAYGLPQVHHELGALRAERFSGLNCAAYVLAKVAVLIPVLAVADAVLLVVPAVLGRLPGYGPAFVTALLSSAVAFALGLLLSAAMPVSPRAALSAAAVGFPPVLLAAAPLAAALVALLDRPIWGDWLVLLVVTAALLAATTVLIARRSPRAATTRLAAVAR